MQRATRAGLFIAAVAFGLTLANAQEATLTAGHDRQRLMDILRIKALRPAPNPPNYDEASANPYPNLPDPLKLKDGRAVANPDMWWQQRRQEIADDYEDEVYGRTPPVALDVAWLAGTSDTEKTGGVPFMTKRVIGRAGNLALGVAIPLTVTLPANAKKPVPVILELAASDSDTSTRQRQVLAKGWGIAVLDLTKAQADDGAQLTRGVIGISTQGKPRTPIDWGVLRAWAWTASRALDCLESDPAVDSAHVGIAGASLYGNAALLAMAYDARFVVAFIEQPSGPQLLRRNFGETIGDLVSTGAYQRFDGNLLKYDGPNTTKDLPVDAHDLFALSAPRPVFVSFGNDKTSDVRGAFMAEVAAGPVYRLLGAKDLGATVFPRPGQALMIGALAFHQNPKGADADWPQFLRYAAPYLKPKAKHKT